MRNTLAISVLLLTNFSLPGQETIIYYLSGIDKDHTVLWDFVCTAGRQRGEKKKIPVPSNWELQGFGSYNYGHDKTKPDEKGLYKYSFRAEKEWKDRITFIVFEGSMTDTEVKINGKSAGPVHQGGFYRFKYEISSLLHFNSGNLLEVLVSKQSGNSSVNRAERSGDFWTLGGIYRPVYLEIVPKTYIERVTIDAKANGSFKMAVFGQSLSENSFVEAQVQTLKGENFETTFTVKPIKGEKFVSQLIYHFKDPLQWSPEFPNLYQVIVSIKNNKETIHTITQRFGFRTIELRLRDGIYLNGKRLIFKGVNRHSLWPESGRTLSKDISILDVTLMKEMNMNAVRMSHYPPDRHFLDVCDSIGLMVIDELTGWQAAYDTLVGRKLVKELVTRDVNHPSIVIWANGNEGGWNRGIDGDYHLYDPQNRLVIHPWENFNGVDTKHYPVFNYVVNSSIYGQEPFFPTEFMHGLYDGGHGAGLEDYWNQLLKHPFGAGGFLWAFHDEGIVRTDKSGIIDTDGNHAPDGILGPHREKEASFYTIKELWSPVFISKSSINSSFNGQLEIENRFIFTNLDQCSFVWKLVSIPFPHLKNVEPITNATGKLQPLSLAPGEKGLLKLGLPSSWSKSDVLYLAAYDPYQRELFTWSWSIKSPDKIEKLLNTTDATHTIDAREQGNSLIIRSAGVTFYFDKTTGFVEKVENSTSRISLSGGPVTTGLANALKSFTHYRKEGFYNIEAAYENDDFKVKWIFEAGLPARLQYQYSKRGQTDFSGITFNYPEENITGMKWLGRGPYRVWKNRLKGMQFGVWQKQYNNTITGESWQYPEFKGYHAELYWVIVENKESPFTIYTDNHGVFLQMLKPEKPVGASNENTSPPFPDGNLGFLHAISPIGTKFNSAEMLGPQSQKNLSSYVSGSLWLDFR